MKSIVVIQSTLMTLSPPNTDISLSLHLHHLICMHREHGSAGFGVFAYVPFLVKWCLIVKSNDCGLE